MTAVVNTVSPFTIEEMTGERRVLRLVGRALPYRPFNLKTKQRVELTWYPGNPEATATVLGAAEEPTQINGMWKDKFISNQVEAASIASGAVETVLVFPITLNDEPVDNVRLAVVILDDIIRAGQQLRVSWDEQTRVGHLTQFDKNWDNYHDLTWSMTFEWISRGEPTVPTVFTTSVSLSDSSGRIAAAAADFRATINEITLPPGEEIADLLTESVTSIDDSVLAVTTAVSSTVRKFGAPFEAARRVISSCTQIILQAEATIVGIQSQVNGYFDAAVSLADQSFQRRLSWAAYGRQVIRSARRLRQIAVEQRNALAKQIESTLLAVYTARQGEDLRLVSETFYGSPFDWRSLLTFNELTSTALVAGQVILVPRRPGQRK